LDEFVTVSLSLIETYNPVQYRSEINNQRPATAHTMINDTAADAEAAWRICIRGLTPAQRLAKACALSQRGRRAAMDVIRRKHPAESPQEQRLRFIELAFGSALARDVRRWLEERDR
jgi:hypothetical protein